MNYYVGADLGTSSIKLLLVAENGEILKSASRSYEVVYPRNGWSEQEPSLWWDAFLDGMRELLANGAAAHVKAIGVGGQMHGLVTLDAEDKVIRPAILWNDGRTAEEVVELNEGVGKEVLSGWTANIAFAGFTAPKILWMKKNEPELFERVKRIMLPKDYINYLLTGKASTDLSDASGMLLLDVAHRCWSKDMLSLCGITEEMLPRLYESYETVGTVLPNIADALGISHDVKVVAGAGDNAAAAIGTGTVGEGKCNISLGTSGTVFISSEHFSVDKENALHAFCHADGGYHLMGCMLSAASCNKWFIENVLVSKEYDALFDGVDEARLGENDVYFLPYLMGERSPINDTDARGVFVGMTPETSREDMLLAVIEGVSFAIKDSLEVARKQGISLSVATLCGGGARLPIWRKVLANVLNLPLSLPVAEEGPGYGGAILAMTADGVFADVKEGAVTLFAERGRELPEPTLSAKYAAKYEKYKKIYPALKNVFKELKD